MTFSLLDILFSTAVGVAIGVIAMIIAMGDS